jgi:hypothetical protein
VRFLRLEDNCNFRVWHFNSSHQAITLRMVGCSELIVGLLRQVLVFPRRVCQRAVLSHFTESELGDSPD